MAQHIVSTICSKIATLKVQASYCWHVQRFWKYCDRKVTIINRNLKKCQGLTGKDVRAKHSTGFWVQSCRDCQLLKIVQHNIFY